MTIARRRAEQLRDVKTDAAGADEGDALAGVAASVDDFDVARDLRVVEPWDRWSARHDAGREDYFVESGEITGARAPIEPHVDAELREPRPKITQRLGELLLTRDAPRQVELAADLRRSFEERHRVTAFRGGHRTRHAGGTGTDDGDLLARLGWGELEFGLATGVRIHQARGGLPLEDLVEARLVAADARIDFVGEPERCLAHELRIGEKRPRHRHHVSIATREQRLGRRRI